MANQLRPVTHVLFDMDGVVLNTEPIYERVFKAVTEKYGKKLTPEVRLKLLGTTELRSCETCVNDLELNVSLEQFTRDFHEMSQKLLGNVDLMPGAERLVKHLHANNIPICVATSSCEESVGVKIAKHQEVFKLFHHITKGTDPEVKHGKPAPDIFLVAASRFDPAAIPSNCLVLEDAPTGVQGAKSAGMQVVMMPADSISDELRSKATMVIKSLECFKPELFGLPPLV